MDGRNLEISQTTCTDEQLTATEGWGETFLCVGGGGGCGGGLL